MKKKNEIKYGIEITKPFSKDMYSHNDMVAKEMKFNIKDAWHNEAIKFMGDDQWPTEGKIVEIIWLIGNCMKYIVICPLKIAWFLEQDL